jgi:hypothetical protein
MTRRSTIDDTGNRGPETIRLDQGDWMKMIGGLMGLSATFFGSLIYAGWTVSTAIHEADLNSERRITKVETVVEDHGRRIGDVEGQLRGGKP